MGVKGGAPGARPPAAAMAPAIVCCMCGDRGLPEELFRCKACLFRSQHKYCSDLYPKVELYKACNWCLREGIGKSRACETKTMTTSDSSSGPSSSGNGGSGFRLKLQRGSPAPLLISKPVKKQRALGRASSSSTEKMRREELSPSPPPSPLPAPARIGKTFRGKVRRYKLLEEVSSQIQTSARGSGGPTTTLLGEETGQVNH